MKLSRDKELNGAMIIKMISVPLKIESLNKTLRQHWSKRAKEKKLWFDHIRAACNWKPPQAKGKMRVIVTSYRKRLLDTDNLVGGAKGLRDSMKDLGMVMDDSPKWSEWIYEQKLFSEFGVAKAKNEVTTIRLEEA